MKVENDALEAARIAWVDAMARADELEQADRQTAAKLREAINTREGIIDRMSCGEEGLHKSDYTQSLQIVRERELASKLASAMALGARRRADEKHVEFLHEKVKDSDARKAAARGRVLSKAAKLDRSVATAKNDAEELVG